MTTPISIPALRETVADRLPVDPGRVLALVEAVEAAQVYYDGDGTPGTYTRHKVRQRLADALARFDFGELR